MITKVLLFAVFFLLSFPLQTPAANGRERCDILILNSFHENLPWSRGLMKGFHSMFDNSDLNLELHVEYMDSLRHPRLHFFDELTALYKEKYRDLTPKVLITTDDTALDFLLTRRDEIFPGIPVVFCSPGSIDRKRIFGEKQITGVFDPLNIEDTVELALLLHPHAQRIAVISDRGPAGKRRLRRLEQVKPLFENRVEFTILTDESLESLRKEILNLPHTTLLLFFSFLFDRTGKDYSGSRDILKELTRDFDLPVYAIRKIDVSCGTVGGMVSSGELMAGVAAEMSIRVITGEPAGGIPVVDPLPTLAMFDFLALKRFGLSRSLLPEGTLLVNKPFSFFRQYRKLVLGVGATITFLVIFIALLFINITRRRHAEQEVQQACLLQEEVVTSRTKELTRINSQLQREISHRKQVNRALRESEALFNSFMKHLPGRAFIKDRKGRYIYLSDSYRKLLKVDPARLINSTDKEIWPRSLGRIFAENDRLAMERQDSMTTVEKIPVDGEVEHHLITRFPLFKNARPEKLAAIAFDISERVKAEADRKKLESRLIQSQKIESIGTLAGGIAHDFNNLLMGIQGNIAIIEMRTEKEHPNLEKIGIIKELIASGADLTKQLLGFARGGKYDVKPVDINDLLKKCIKMFGRTRKGVTLYEDFEEEAWTVEVDGKEDQALPAAAG